MIHFYVVRHGQTLFNVRERIQGWSDSPLTELGFNQAKALGEKLDISDFKAAYSSSSERALDTLDAVLNGRTMPIHATKGLKEVSFGVLEGKKSMMFFLTGIRYWQIRRDTKRKIEGKPHSGF